MTVEITKETQQKSEKLFILIILDYLYLQSKDQFKDQLIIIKDQLVLFCKVKINCQLILSFQRTFQYFETVRWEL